MLNLKIISGGQPGQSGSRMSMVTGLRLMGRLTAPQRTQSTGGSRFNIEIIGSSKRFPTDFFSIGLAQMERSSADGNSSEG